MFDYHRWLSTFPGTNFHELNIDWVVQAIKELALELKNFEAANTIHYEGAFDITKQYPAWSIVVDNNYGYISTKPVPAGIAVTNTEYWENIADFSALYADLGSRVTALESNVNGINNTLPTLARNTFKGRRIICISDSYGHKPSTGDNWIVTLKNISGLSSSDFASDYHDGSGFIGLGAGRPTFLEMLQGVSISSPSTVTDIIVSGGYNDAAILGQGASDANMRAAITTFLSYANSTYPNAKITIAPSCWCIHDYSMHSLFRQMLNDYNQCPTLGKNAVYTDAALYVLHDIEHLDNSGFHPTSIGAQLIGESIASNLLGGSGYISTPQGKISPVITANSSEGVTGITFAVPLMFMDGNVVHFNTNLINITGSSMSCLAGRLLKVGTFTKTIMTGGVEDKEFYLANTIAVDDQHNYFNCQVMIAEGSLYLRPMKDAISGATQIDLYGVQLTGSAMI